jgi:hypothetical protein
VSVAVASPSARNDDYAPQWTLDLHQHGYEQPKPQQKGPLWKLLGLGPRNELAFVDNETLAVSFFVRNPNPGLSVRGKVAGGQQLFQTIFVDAKTGNILHVDQWSNASGHCGLFPLSDGLFVVWSDDELILHGHNGTTLKTATVFDPKSTSVAGFKVAQSITGNTLLAIGSDRRGRHVRAFRAADLSEIAAFDLPGYATESASDSQFAILQSRLGTMRIMDLFIRPIVEEDSPSSGQLKRIFTSAPPSCYVGTCLENQTLSSAQPSCDSVTFLDDRTLAVSGMCHSITFMSTSGDIIYTRQFERVLTDRVVPCRSCDLIVFGTYVLKGGSAFLDTFPKAQARNTIILNRVTNKLIELPDRSAKHHASTALSPNGCFLARQRDSRLELYNLCDSPIGTKLHIGKAP